MAWQSVKAEGEVSAARGRRRKILPLVSGWAALSRAKALPAKAAASGMKLPATVALRLPASTALWEALPATGRHQAASPMMGLQAE